MPLQLGDVLSALNSVEAGIASATYRGITTAGSTLNIARSFLRSATFSGGTEALVSRGVRATASHTETFSGNSGRLDINLPESIAEGAAGNGWRFVLGRAVGSRPGGVTGIAFSVDTINRVVNITRGNLVGPDILATAINNEYGAGTASATQVAGSQFPAFDSSRTYTFTFADGVDAVRPRPRTPLEFRIDIASRNLTIHAIATDTLTEIATEINSTIYSVLYGPGPEYAVLEPPHASKSATWATVVGSGASTLQALLLVGSNPNLVGAFSAGTDIEPIHGSVDRDNKVAQLHYATIDTMAQLKEFINGEELQSDHSRFVAVEIARTDLTRGAVAPGSTDVPFINFMPFRLDA